MAGRNETPLERQQAAWARGERADRFWEAFLITKNGKVKSSLLMNSFCLCLLFMAVYGLCFWVLVDPLHALLAGLPTGLENLFSALVPTLLGTGVCCLCWPLCKEKRTFTAAFFWMLLWALAILLTMVVLMWGETGTMTLFLRFYLLLVPAPVLAGNAAAILLYRRHWARQRARREART